MQAVGVDIGSSSLKACLFDLSEPGRPTLVRGESRACPLLRTAPDRAEHDLAGMEAALRELLGGLPAGARIGFTSAMHGLVMLDELGRPLGPCLSWADGRAAQEAGELRLSDPTAHDRTGTPLHPMAWPAKLLWMKRHRPDLWERAARLTDLKGYLLESLTGERCPVDLSNASATGLWNPRQRSWDQALLRLLQLDPSLLPSVASPYHGLAWLNHRLVLGAGDGPVGNLGVGAVNSERVAISLGTSGAIRQRDGGGAPLDPALFRYALDGDVWVKGGAISNGTSVLDWLMKQGRLPLPEVLAEAAASPPGALGLRVYPYFSGERAPFWRPDMTSHIAGWSFDHEFKHLARAAIEGVAFCLRRLYDVMAPPSEAVRCTGGFFASALWRQLLADVLNLPVSITPVKEATALGAALLTISDPLEYSLSLPLGELTEPSPLAERYQDLYRLWADGEPNT